MLKNIRTQKAQSTIEFMVMFMILIIVVLAMQKYVLRGLNGRAKTAVDSFSFGRQFDPKKTLECEFDYVYTNKWYSVAAFEEYGCHCDRLTSSNASCYDCIDAAGNVFIPGEGGEANRWERLCEQ